MSDKKPEPRIINLLTAKQLNTLIEGVEQSAFVVEIIDGDAVLKAAGKEVFRVDLAGRTITRCRGASEEKLFACEPRKWFRWSKEKRIFDRLETAIKTQYEMGSEEALTTNLLTRAEIVVLIDAIRAMAFKLDRSGVNSDTLIIYFEGRECFRIDTYAKAILMIGLSNVAEVAYTFSQEPEEWFWAGTDRRLWKDLMEAIKFYNSAMHKVRMSDYRAMFGSQMTKVITDLAKAMDEAEADARLLERVDKTSGGTQLHPDVARLVQKDLEAGEQAAAEEEQP